MKKKSYILHFFAVKFIPILCCFIMTIHWGLRLLGYNSYFTEWFTGCSVTTLILYFLASSVLGLCWVHKMQVAYIALGSFCIDFQRCFGFGEASHLVRLILLILGIVVIVISLIKVKCPPYDNAK